MSDINSAIIERLERVVETLQENSVKMGQILAVHNEKLDKQDKIDEVLFDPLKSADPPINSGKSLEMTSIADEEHCLVAISGFEVKYFAFSSLIIFSSL